VDLLVMGMALVAVMDEVDMVVTVDENAAGLREVTEVVAAIDSDGAATPPDQDLTTGVTTMDEADRADQAVGEADVEAVTAVLTVADTTRTDEDHHRGAQSPARRLAAVPFLDEAHHTSEEDVREDQSLDQGHHLVHEAVEGATRATLHEATLGVLAVAAALVAVGP